MFLIMFLILFFDPFILAAISLMFLNTAFDPVFTLISDPVSNLVHSPLVNYAFNPVFKLVFNLFANPVFDPIS